MVWLSINPDSEPVARQLAAAAISSIPGKRDFLLFSIRPDREQTLDNLHHHAIKLANDYNNVEVLELDILSLSEDIGEGSGWF